jgi:hypothetical protein
MRRRRRVSRVLQLVLGVSEQNPPVSETTERALRELELKRITDEQARARSTLFGCFHIVL